MTTIAVRNGVMASDSQYTHQDLRTLGQKIFRVNESILGISGHIDAALVFIDWFKDREARRPDLANEGAGSSSRTSARTDATTSCRCRSGTYKRSTDDRFNQLKVSVNDTFRHQLLMATCVLTEASRLVNGDRAVDYGSPTELYSRMAALWSAYLGVPVSAKDCVALFILAKLAREKGKHKRDSIVDIAGYADILFKVEMGE